MKAAGRHGLDRAHDLHAAEHAAEADVLLVELERRAGVKKNCELLVSGPRFAMLTRPASAWLSQPRSHSSAKRGP